MSLFDNNVDDEHYRVSNEDEDDKEEERRDDVPMEDLDPAEDFAMHPHR